MNTLMKDIAQATGFSINTVSRALRDDCKISKRTRELIRAKADAMGYIHNAIAANMRCLQSKVIGVISKDSSNPFFAEVVRGIEERAREHGYNMLLVNTEEDAQRERDYVRLFVSRHVDGLLVVPGYQCQENLQLYKSLSIPFCFVGRRVQGIEGHSLLHQDYESQLEVSSYLIANGHRRMLYLAGPENLSNSADRLNGHLKALENAGIALDPSLIIHTRGHIEEGYASVNLALNRGIRFSVITCFNDLLAMGALKSLSENGCQVPKDVEVFGFDNLYISQFMQPSLSTVDVPKFALGVSAVDELLRHIERRDLEYKDLNLETRLIYRGSTLNRGL